MSMEQAIAEAPQSLEMDLLTDTTDTIEEAKPGSTRAEERGPTYPDDLTEREVAVLRLICPISVQWSLLHCLH
jgi:DNA-binding NarL/FixJ family response regulator